MVDDRLEFSDRLRAIALLDKRQPPNILRPIVTVDFESSRRLEQLHSLRTITAIQFKLRVDQRNLNCVDQLVLRKTLLHFINQRLRGARLVAGRERAGRLIQTGKIAREGQRLRRKSVDFTAVTKHGGADRLLCQKLRGHLFRFVAHRAADCLLSKCIR